MRIKRFKKKLSQVAAATNDQVMCFKKISIEDCSLNITLRSRRVVKIDIVKLHELFNKYDRINALRISKDLKLNDSKEAKAIIEIFKEAGLYKNNRFKKGLVPWLKRFALTKMFVAFISLFLPLLFIIKGIYTYYPDSHRSGAQLFVIAILFFINISFFIFLVLDKNRKSEGITYSALFSLMIFNIGIFPLFNYIKDYKDRNSEKVQYTIGLRAWASEVEFYDIKVKYFDSDGIPWSLPDEIVNDSKFWKTEKLWEEDNKANNLEPAEIKWSVDSIKKRLIIKNCGAVLNPDKLRSEYKAFLTARDYYVEAKFSLIHVDKFYADSAYHRQYQSAQICLKVPINPENEQASDIYYAFEYPFYDFKWSKLRIPGFNFDYVDAQLEHRILNNPNDREAVKISASIDSTIFNNLYGKTDPKDIKTALIGRQIRLSALLLDENVSFNIFEKDYSHSLPLFNFNLSKYGAFTLKEK